ncbi:MAG: biotin-dependent carboxyltransferase family protein, partial [Pyrinomonadaceae bacterium]
MTIKVLQPGLLTTIQDCGRRGFQMLGVNVGGAMDTVSHRIANILVGNDEREATIEITLKGPTLLFEESSLIAICGGNLSPEIDGIAVPMWRPVLVKKQSVLRFGKCVAGCRAYLAHAGEMNLPSVLGSKSVNLRAGFGGLEGRQLQPDDMIHYRKPGLLSARILNSLEQSLDKRPFAATNWSAGSFSAGIVKHQKIATALRIVRGTHFDKLSDESKGIFLHETFRVSSASDRMGYRLEGERLKLNKTSELLSEPVQSGTIQ